VYNLFKDKFGGVRIANVSILFRQFRFMSYCKQRQSYCFFVIVLSETLFAIDVKHLGMKGKRREK